MYGIVRRKHPNQNRDQRPRIDLRRMCTPASGPPRTRQRAETVRATKLGIREGAESIRRDIICDLQAPYRTFPTDRANKVPSVQKTVRFGPSLAEELLPLNRGREQAVRATFPFPERMSLFGNSGPSSSPADFSSCLQNHRSWELARLPNFPSFVWEARQRSRIK